MIIVRSAHQLTQLLNRYRSNQIIGFVPTMGALHDGHLSLVERALAECQIVVVSIFVNPTQFNNPGDLAHYPRTIEQDISLLAKAKATILFLPDVKEMYPNGTDLAQPYPLGPIESLWEGAFRPGHFQGVCQIVDRLLALVQPHSLFMGEKDFQQCMVIAKLIAIKPFAVKLITCPTQREVDGLAMSSRNRRLSPEQREIAPQIAVTLAWMQTQKTMPLDQLISTATKQLTQAGFKIDYVGIAAVETLVPLPPAVTLQETKAAVALIAAYLGDIRLIDNRILVD